MCTPSSGTLRAWHPVTVRWALGTELALTPPSVLPPGASLALGPTCGGGCLLCSLDRAGLPSSKHRSPWQGHLDLRLLCPVSHFLFGREPHLARKRPWLGHRGHFPAACFQWRILGQSRAGASPGSHGVNGRGWAAGSGRCAASLAGPTHPLQGTAGTRRGPYSPLRLQGHRFPFHVERKLTACLQEQLGFVPSAVARRLQQAGQSRLCPGGPGANGSTLAPAQEPWGVEVGPQGATSAGPPFPLTAPETGRHCQGGGPLSPRTGVLQAARRGGPILCHGPPCPRGPSGRCKQLWIGFPFSRLPRARSPCVPGSTESLLQAERRVGSTWPRRGPSRGFMGALGSGSFTFSSAGGAVPPPVLSPGAEAPAGQPPLPVRGKAPGAPSYDWA